MKKSLLVKCPECSRFVHIDTKDFDSRLCLLECPYCQYTNLGYKLTKLNSVVLTERQTFLH